MLTKKGQAAILQDIPLETLTRRIRELSPRKQEILALVAMALTNQDIAAHTGIREGTVKQHVSNLIREVLKPLVPNVRVFSKRAALTILFRRYEESQRSLPALLGRLRIQRAEHEATLTATNREIKEVEDLLAK